MPFKNNVEKYCTVGEATDDTKIRRMRFQCWITKATDTHSEYVRLAAFPRREWLREHSSLLLFYLDGVSFLSCICGVCVTTVHWGRSHLF